MKRMIIDEKQKWKLKYLTEDELELLSILNY